MGIAILKAGKVVVTLIGAKPEELADHIRNGYPQFIPDLPVLTAEELPDDALPPVDPPFVVPPTSEELAALEAKAQLDLATRKMFQVAFNHENRIRALEGKVAVSAAQFKAALLVL
jgi:hypothetical protein